MGSALHQYNYPKPVVKSKLHHINSPSIESKAGRVSANGGGSYYGKDSSYGGGSQMNNFDQPYIGSKKGKASEVLVNFMGGGTSKIGSMMMDAPSNGNYMSNAGATNKKRDNRYAFHFQVVNDSRSRDGKKQNIVGSGNFYSDPAGGGILGASS
jgi:hypothetical protein